MARSRPNRERAPRVPAVRRHGSAPGGRERRNGATSDDMTELRVPSTEYPDVAAALAAAPAGASIALAAGVYRVSTLRLERSISLVGSGAAVTVIESEAATALACLGGSAELSDLSVRQVICCRAAFVHPEAAPFRPSPVRAGRGSFRRPISSCRGNPRRGSPRTLSHHRAKPSKAISRPSRARQGSNGETARMRNLWMWACGPHTGQRRQRLC